MVLNMNDHNHKTHNGQNIRKCEIQVHIKDVNRDREETVAPTVIQSPLVRVPPDE